MSLTERDERHWNLLGVKYRGGRRGVSVAGPALPVGEYVEVVPASQLAGVVEALRRRYGRHTGGCATLTAGTRNDDVCSCGFSTAIQGAADR